MSLIVCPECGHQVSNRARTCPGCGVDIAGNIIECPQCGRVRFIDEPQCPYCESASVPVSNTSESIKENAHDGSSKEAPSPKKSFRISKTTVFSLVVAVLFVSGSIFGYFYLRSQNEEEAYNSAMASKLPPVLRTYLDKYGSYAPEEHRTTVEKILADYDSMNDAWLKAIAQPTKSSLESFIYKYPKSTYVTEAKVIIDSLDWLEATKANTLQSYKKYIDNHSSGVYIDEARAVYHQLDSETIPPADSLMAVTVLTNYFQALSVQDAEQLKPLFTNRIVSFLHKPNSTLADVVAYMKRLHAPKDILSVTMTPLEDWVITKEIVDDKPLYSVSFTVDHKISRTNLTKQSFHTYNVDSKVNHKGKITELNMQRIQQ